MNQNQIVIRPAVAKKLLKLGYTIYDLKPQRNLFTGELDFTRTVFVFKYEEGLIDAINKVVSET